MTYDGMYSMARVVKKYLDPNQELKILDVGSMDVHHPSKKLNFGRYLNKPPKWSYTGVDIAPGRNVDVVSSDPYSYPFPDGSFDVVVSGNTLEHVEDTHRFIKELARLSRGLVIILVPNTRPEHKYPIDCWRVFPDGLRFLMSDIANLNIIQIYKDSGSKQEDTIGIASKYEYKKA